MGYVGIVTAACLSKLGHTVTGVEPNLEKVDMLNNGKTPIQEPQLEKILKHAVESKSLKTVSNYNQLENDYDVSFICVGTPLQNSGEMSLNQLVKVTNSIGEYINKTTNYHLVVIRSTVTPGTSRKILLPILQNITGNKFPDKFGIASNPEFLRETTAVSDFLDPQYTIIGSLDSKSSDTLSNLYTKLKGSKHILTMDESEMLKLSSNAFHALKVGFANEIGRYSEKLQIDSHKVMDIFIEDKKLNISKSYLKPGFAFGGSCLPKDLQSLTTQSQNSGIDLPILEGTLTSNNLHIEHAASKILSHEPKSIGILGLGFKPKSDDVRESPSVRLIQKLTPYCSNIYYYDPDININTMLGSNLEYLKSKIPNISNMVCDNLDDLIKKSSLMVITQTRTEFSKLYLKAAKEKIIVDLVNLKKDR
tara:strand:- start:3380 stop:4639 length:1260 start_codon:yes stop_codon:yes gene_type:complete